MASKDSNPTKPMSHTDCLPKLCIICYEKGRILENLTENVVKKIEKHEIVKNILAVHNPRKICMPCRKDLFKPKDAGVQILKDRRSQKQPSFDDLASMTLDGACPCKICSIVREKKPPPKRKKAGRPQKISNTLICGKCMDPNCNGINCESSTTVKETASKVIETNPRMAEAIASKIIKDTDPSPKGTIRLAQGSGGAELPLTLGSSVKKPKKIEVSTEEVNVVRQEMGVGITKIRHLTRFLNAKGAKVEAGHQQKLVEMTHVLDGHFALVEECEFLDSNKRLITRPLAYCKNLSEFVLCVTHGRGLDPHNTKVLFNVDNSENFSEYSISIIDLLEDPNARLKSSGPSHSLLVAISPKVPENHFNFKKVLEMIFAHEVRMLYINDLKATLILIGNQSSSCKHPCPFCLTSDMTQIGVLRTIGEIVTQNQKYVESGLDRKHLQDFGNCEFLPLITDDFEGDWDKLVLDFCPPPGLHIMLGIVNQQVKLAEEVAPKKVKEWVKYSKAKRNAYQGGTFEGNSCKRLVDNIDYLEMLAENDFDQHSCYVLSIVNVLRKFRQVRHSCFGKVLQPDYATHLDEYTKALDNLVSDFNVSVIVKNHITEFHIKTWCDRNGVGLGARSEQTAEAIHKRFWKHWSGGFQSTGLSEGQRLLKALCVFDANNAHFKTGGRILCPHTNRLELN